jgi:hypothetical protein
MWPQKTQDASKVTSVGPELLDKEYSLLNVGYLI